ncbi:ATP-binding protein [Micromonospora sp. DT201]|uniref:ATP-binding protein n=1 Tax=Micromonospora sp. DT201 TaxID=3393442 RepID=UPI003CEF38DE
MLGTHAVAEESALNRLLSNSTNIGGVFDLGYKEASIITNDAWLARAFGLPQHCFLLAFPRKMGIHNQADEVPRIDRGVILLRVLRETSLPNQADLVHLRAEDSDRAITNFYRDVDELGPETDVLTRAMMQQAAFRCRVIGTFVENDAGDLVFGKDVDNIYAAGRYMVAKPHGGSLQLIIDHVELPMGERVDEQRGDEAPNADLPDTEATIEIGKLRYSSSRQRERIATANGKTTEVAVQVRPKDFVAHKTAVFGMTRAGKSNTMKVLASAVHLYAYKTNSRVGQLIFDPAGEYAYANRQDHTALSQLGEDVRIYRLGATAVERAQNIRPLSINFFDDSQIDGSWSLITSFLGDDTRQFVRNFLASDPSRSPEDMDDYGDKNRLEAVRAMYFGILIKAGFKPKDGWTCSIPINDKTRTLLSDVDDIRIPARGPLRVSAQQLEIVCEVIARNAALKKKDDSIKEAVKLWFSDRSAGGHGDPGVDGLVGMLSPSGSASGWKILRGLATYHSAEATTDFAPAIYADLAHGRLVIVDLSRGSDQVLQTCAERVVREILSRASRRFREGHPPRPMQIFLEEAHRLLDRDKFNKTTSVSDPYVRLAKESAKYKIGMIYATQEVSSVDPMILSNTANWVCAYMNNAAETQKLAKYYDFADFAEQILSADDRGFVRLRTDSSPYTLPVQVAKFDLGMVNAVRAATGLPPTGPSTDYIPDISVQADDLSDCEDPDAIYAKITGGAGSGNH